MNEKSIVAIVACKTYNKNEIYNAAKCIRCYCCQEICPKGAIRTKIPLLGVIFKCFASQFWD